MKRVLQTGLIGTLLTAFWVQAAPVDVRIQTRDRKIHIGKLHGLSGGVVRFQPSGAAAPVQMPVSQISYVQFPVDDDDPERIQRLLDDGRYRELADPLNDVLPPYTPYIQLPSNLSKKFLRWMEVSYWIGEFDRVLELADVLQNFPAEFNEKALFYRGLALLAREDFQSLEAFLSAEDIDTLYPPESAVRLYVEAVKMQHKKEFLPAIRTAALLLALHSGNSDWMPRAELLCAELYFQLNMPESAQAVLADIREFYADPEIQKNAAAIAAKN
jgi:hypothetical protein